MENFLIKTSSLETKYQLTEVSAESHHEVAEVFEGTSFENSNKAVTNEIQQHDSACESDNILEINYNDPALWPPVSEHLREYFTKNIPNQNMNLLGNSKRIIGGKERMCNANCFYRIKKNGDQIKRDWLIYSPSQKALFCYICKLYCTNDQALSKTGFNDWRNVSKRLSSHENSSSHRESVISYSQRCAAANRIDQSLIELLSNEQDYWKKVLHRVVAVIKFISQRGLALFGDNETFGSLHNGNFLGLLELISSFDPFIADHIQKYGNKGKGNVNYLSSTIVSELINIMAKKVLQHILTEVKQAKYFGLIVDSTPDITHIDQLAIVVRYVNSEGDPMERFLRFLPIHAHNSLHLHDVIIDYLQSMEIDLKYCRGQSYDNASNMAGKYTGLQARLKNDFPLIEYVPCSAHSLNLVGTSAAECNKSAISFFGCVQSVYNFFSASTHRWKLLTQKFSSSSSSLNLKSLSSTRWSSNADAVKAIKDNYLNLIEVLSSISKNSDENASTRHEAKSLICKIDTFEFCLLIVIWDKILQRLNKVNKTLQSPTCEINAIVPLYESLISFIQTVRDSFEQFEKEAEKFSTNKMYAKKRKIIPTKSRMLDESNTPNIQLSDRELFMYNIHYVICDSVITELNKRKEAYIFLESRFGFLYPKEKGDIERAAKEFQKIYADDVDDDFIDEFLQFDDLISKKLTPIEKLKTIKSLGIEHTFPNVETSLRILLSIPLSNCSSERSFSTLKRIKHRLRSSLSEKNLCDLSILSIESDVTDKLNFDEVINDFSFSKNRKVL